MKNIRKSLSLSLAAKYSELIISVVSILILARLLTPLEFGIYAIGYAIVALVIVFRNFGIGNYLVQEPEMNTARFRTAFGVAILFAGAAAIFLVVISKPVSVFFEEPGLRTLLLTLSLTFLITPLSLPVLALHRREMSFGVLYIASMANALVRSTTAISLAIAGHGYMSLVWATLAGEIAVAVVATVYRPAIAWALPSLRDWQRVVSFGSAFSAMTALTQIGSSAIDLILGRVLGFTAVGVYSRANGLVATFDRDIMGAIFNVVLPAFARQHRENSDLKSSYLKGLNFITLFAWPFYAFLALMADPIVRILFGPQWEAVVPVVQILAPAMAIGALWSLIRQVLLATGHVNGVLHSELIVQPVRILLIIVAAPFGLEAIAASQIAVSVLGMFVYYHKLSQVMNISYSDVVIEIWPSLKITLYSLVAPLILLIIMDFSLDDSFVPFILVALGSGLGWIFGLLSSNHPGKTEILTGIQHMFGR